MENKQVRIELSGILVLGYNRTYAIIYKYLDNIAFYGIEVR